MNLFEKDSGKQPRDKSFFLGELPVIQQRGFFPSLYSHLTKMCIMEKKGKQSQQQHPHRQCDKKAQRGRGTESVSECSPPSFIFPQMKGMKDACDSVYYRKGGEKVWMQIKMKESLRKCEGREKYEAKFNQQKNKRKRRKK